MGVTRGSAQKMKKGGLPSMDTLALICRVENASYRYLVEGVGAPFQVTRMASDAELADHLDALLEEGWWDIHLIEHAGVLRAMVLTKPCQVVVGEGGSARTVDYTCMEVAAGPVGEKTLSMANAIKLNAGYAARRVRRVEFDADTLRRLLAGEMGTWALLRAPDAPLGLKIDRAAEDLAPYTVTPTVEDAEALAIARAIEDLDEPAREHVKALVAMLKKRAG